MCHSVPMQATSAAKPPRCAPSNPHHKPSDQAVEALGIPSPAPGKDLPVTIHRALTDRLEERPEGLEIVSNLLSPLAEIVKHLGVDGFKPEPVETPFNHMVSLAVAPKPTGEGVQQVSIVSYGVDNDVARVDFGGAGESR